MSYAQARKRHEEQANDQPGDHGLRCQAHGCTERWSCDMGNGRLCSWHDREDDRNRWPQITEELKSIRQSGGVPKYPPLRCAPRKPTEQKVRRAAEPTAAREAMLVAGFTPSA